MFCRKCGKDIGELEKCPSCEFEEQNTLLKSEDESQIENFSAESNRRFSVERDRDIKTILNDDENEEQLEQGAKATCFTSQDTIAKWKKENKIGKAHSIYTSISISTLAGAVILLMLFSLFTKKLSLPKLFGLDGLSNDEMYQLFVDKISPAIGWLVIGIVLVMSVSFLLEALAKKNLAGYIIKNNLNVRKILRSNMKSDKPNNMMLTEGLWIAEKPKSIAVYFVKFGVSIIAFSFLGFCLSKFFTVLVDVMFHSFSSSHIEPEEVFKQIVLSNEFLLIVLLTISVIIFKLVIDGVVKSKSEENLSNK